MEGKPSIRTLHSSRGTGFQRWGRPGLALTLTGFEARSKLKAPPNTTPSPLGKRGNYEEERYCTPLKKLNPCLWKPFRFIHMIPEYLHLQSGHDKHFMQKREKAVIHTGMVSLHTNIYHFKVMLWKSSFNTFIVFFSWILTSYIVLFLTLLICYSDPMTLMIYFFVILIWCHTTCSGVRVKTECTC